MAQIYYYLGHEQFQPEILVRHAQLAEASGFDGIFISEHFNPWVTDKGAAGFALSTLGAIAQATKKIKLMTGVITPLFRYHPAVVAQAAATIDRLSDGRFQLGVGTGEPINEVPLGYEFPKYKERSDQMRESLQIMKKLLHGDKVTFEGHYFKTKNAKLYSPPLHPIQILLAAGGPKSAELAGEFADGLIVSVKDPTKAIENVINPAKAKANNNKFLITASRWVVYAKTKMKPGTRCLHGGDYAHRVN
jgi:coenzyme F420-dependent glucose-6-phosphate dehydrogenase